MPEPIEYVVREFNDRGLIWLLESPTNLEHFIRLFAAEIADRLDFSRAERIPRSFITSDLEKTETDILFRLPARSGEDEVLIYVLNELQSASDNEMGLKIYLRRGEIWKHEKRVWQDLPVPRPDFRLHMVVPIVFYTGETSWTVPVGVEALMDTPDGMSVFIPKWKTLFVSLKLTPREVLLDNGTGVGLVLAALQAAQSDIEEMKTVVAQIVAGLSRLPLQSQEEWSTAMHFLLLMIRHKRNRTERNALYKVIESAVDSRRRQEVETMIVSDAELLRQEGREEILRESILDIVSVRFGRVPDTIRIKVDNVQELETLRHMRKSALEAATLSQFEEALS